LLPEGFPFGHIGLALRIENHFIIAARVGKASRGGVGFSAAAIGFNRKIKNVNEEEEKQQT